jgi:hypothetical protein
MALPRRAKLIAVTMSARQLAVKSRDAWGDCA